MDMDNGGTDINRWCVKYSLYPSGESKLLSETLRTKMSHNLEFNLELQCDGHFKNMCTLSIHITKKDPDTVGSFVFTLNSVIIFFTFDNMPVGIYYILSLEKHLSIPEEELQISIVYLDRKEERKKILDEFSSRNIIKNFTWLSESSELIDGVIVTEDGTRFSFHKHILAARSPVFLAMFKSGMQEAEGKRVKIVDLSADTVKTMLIYLYTGCVKELTYDSYAELLKAADKYDIPDLKQLCVEHLLLRLDTSNAVDLLLTMDLYRVEDSKEVILSYITNNREHFSKDGAYDALQGNSQLLMELLCKMTIK